eukprot:5709397-Lingulodinium_polyedra.AAC.1
MSKRAMTNPEARQQFAQRLKQLALAPFDISPRDQLAQLNAAIRLAAAEAFPCETRPRKNFVADDAWILIRQRACYRKL